MMKEEYKGWDIVFIERSNIFEATKDDNSIEDANLMELKKKIDKFHFKRIPVYYKEWNKLNAGEITSVIKDSRGGYSVWVTYGEPKSRTKTWLDNIYKRNEKNEQLFSQVAELRKKIDEMNTQIYNLEHQMEKITAKDIEE